MWPFTARGRMALPRDPRMRADIGLPPVLPTHAALMAALGLGGWR